MAKRACAGIVLTSTQVTAAVVESVGDAAELRFTLSEKRSEATSDASSAIAWRSALERLADEVKATCGRLPSAVLALPAQMYFSLVHHSEFTDFGRINATLRFDVEDSYCFDAETAVFCFDQLNATDKGSDLLVHAVMRDRLEPLLDELYQVGLDALAVVPDIDAWREYLVRKLLPKGEGLSLVLASHENIVYVLALDHIGQMRLGRTLLVGATENPAAILEKELPRMITALSEEQQPRRLLYCGDRLSAADMNRLAKTINISATSLGNINWPQAIAAGAAMAWLHRDDLTDFRADRLPPKSLVKGQSKALMALAGVAAILFFALALLFTFHTAACRKQSSKDLALMGKTWTTVYGDRRVPGSAAEIARQLSKALKAIINESDKRGERKAQQASAVCLTFMLRNINRLPDKFDLRIDSLRISGENIFFSGSVPAMKDCDLLQTLFNEDQSGLVVDRISFKTSTGDKTSPGSRISFDMRLVLKTTDERETRKR
ncbi:MAG: hypothetical protein JW709_02920 [Sedimentisphaerales bacterium]|nr:hypothetical protein [Sedimentisphaerales bacterium]